MVRLTMALGLGMLGLALAIGTAETQEKKDSGKAKGLLPPGWKALNLTPVQQQSIYAVQNEYKPKYAELNKQIKELQAKEKSEMAKVLTDEQKAKLVEIVTGEKKATEKKTEDKK